MPDLPPLEHLPEFAPTDLAGVRHAASWASTFGEGDSNLAMRNRHNADIVDYGNALQAAHEAEVMKNITTGKNAFHFWKATEQMAQKERMHKADMAVAAPLQQARMAAAEAAAEAHRVTSMHTAAAEARAAKQATDVANAQERFDSARHDAWTAFGPGSASPDMGRYHQAVMEADMATPAAPATFKGKHVAEAQKFFDAQPKEDDTAGFNNHMAELIARGVKPQSDEWQSGLAVGMSTFPKANPATVSKYGPQTMPNPDALALKERAQATHEAQVASTAKHRESTDLEKEIAAIEKKRAPWKGTTGIFKDSKGVERFGFPAVDALGDKNKVPAEESLPATPELKADYQRYQNLILKRAAQSAGVPIKKFNPETGRIE